MPVVWPPHGNVKEISGPRILVLAAGQTELRTDGSTVLRAQTITIVGKNAAAGQNVYLFADRVIALSNGAEPATIDVSGRAPAITYQGFGVLAGVLGNTGPRDQAESGNAPGARGVDGNASARPRPSVGGVAGSITIVCRELVGDLRLDASGGPGGSGLGGGYGAKGQKGDTGKTHADTAEHARGGPGGRGGDGGKGGDGAAGGNGGAIVVQCEHHTGNVTMTAHAGGAGWFGSGGVAGEGGDGGDGGDYGYVEYDRGPGGGPGGRGVMSLVDRETK